MFTGSASARSDGDPAAGAQHSTMGEHVTLRPDNIEAHKLPALPRQNRYWGSKAPPITATLGCLAGKLPARPIVPWLSPRVHARDMWRRKPDERETARLLQTRPVRCTASQSSDCHPFDRLLGAGTGSRGAEMSLGGVRRGIPAAGGSGRRWLSACLSPLADLDHSGSSRRLGRSRRADYRDRLTARKLRHRTGHSR